MRLTIRLFIALTLLCAASLTFANTVHEYTLKNGLKLFVKKDTRAPIVVSEVWYKVGSGYEYGGITGISHALEHMMFRGTTTYGPEVFKQVVAENGGQENAFTYFDYTAYYQVFSNDKLPISFKFESDRMHNLLLKPKDFAREIQVVMEERRMRIDDNPEALTYERFMAAAHVSNAYHHLTIGWMNDLQNMKDKDLRKWYESWYAPNNAVVVVVGNVDPDKVYQLAKKYFSKINSKKLPTLKPRKEIQPLGEREVVVHAPAKLAYLIMGYNVPSLKTAKESWKSYALAVATGILDGGKSARIPTDIVRGKQIATSADVDYSMYRRLNTLFVLDGNPAPDHTVKELKTAYLAEIKKLQDSLVSEAELNRIKTQVIAANVYKNDSMTYQANEIGSLEAVGLSWRDADDYVKNIKAVTPKQIQMVAREFLTPKRLTVARLDPTAISSHAPTAKPLSGEVNVR